MATEEKSDVDSFLNKYSSTSDSVVKTPDGKEVIVLKEKLLEQYSAELVDFLMNQSRRYKDFGMSKEVLIQIINLKKAYFPATQKSVQIGVDVWENKLRSWIEARKEIKNDKNEVIMEEVKNAINNNTNTDKELKEIDDNNGK